MRNTLALACLVAAGVLATEGAALAEGSASYAGPHRSGTVTWSGHPGRNCCYGGGVAAGAVAGLAVGTVAGAAAARPAYVPPPVVYVPPPVVYAPPPAYVANPYYR